MGIAGKISRNSDGKVWRPSDGKVRRETSLCDGCNCGCKGCTVSKPVSITSVISGTTLCTGCNVYASAPSYYWSKMVSGVIDGTYDLPLLSDTGDACNYVSYVPCNIVVDIYNDAACTIPAGTTSSRYTITTAGMAVAFRLISPGNYIITMGLNGSGFNDVGAALNFTLFSYSNYSASGLCSDGLGTFNNDNISCSFGGIVFTGGTITNTFNY